MNGLNDWNDDEVEMEMEDAEEQEEFEEVSESECDPDELDYDVDIEGDESEYIDECPVNITHFDLIKKLGTGAYGTVFLVKKNCGFDAGQIYALKVITKAEVVKIPKTIVHMKAERKALEILRDCPYIQKLYYAFQTSDKLFLVTEYLPGGEMFTQVQKGPLPESHVRFYMAELIVALEHIHIQGIVYRDIKLENVLLDAEGHVKLVDFGLCKKLGNRQRSKSFCGTEEYMAPEVIACTGHNTAADWWALGVLAIELLSTITPFGSNGPTKIMDRISHEDPIMPPNISEEMENFLMQVLAKDPCKRLGGSEALATSIKEHILFDGLDWHKLANKQLPAPFVPTITHPFDTQNFSDEFTSQPATFNPSEVPPNSFLTFKAYSYIAPELQATQNNHLADSSTDENWNSLTRHILSNRDPDSKFYQKYTIASHQPLGIGKSSVCLKCFDVSDNYYAVKIYKREDVNDNEIDVLEKTAAQHFPGVVHLFEVLTDSKWAYLVMELIDGVNLLEYLSTESLNGKRVHTVVDAIWGMVEKVHELKYTHGRICFNNIYYVKQTRELRLIGFSNTRPITRAEDKQIDYWSMGVCIYTILCGHFPFNLSTSNPTVAYNRIGNSEFDQDSKRWTTLNKDVKCFIDQLFRDPTPTFGHNVLLMVKRSAFHAVDCSKDRLDENERIVEIRASKMKTPLVIKTELICAHNDIERITNGNVPTEIHEDVSDVNADDNHQSQLSNIIPEESQANHTGLNGHVQKTNSKRRKGRIDEQSGPNKYKKPKPDNVESVETAPLLKPEEIKQERELRKRAPINYAQKLNTKLRKSPAKVIPVSTEEVEEEKYSPPQTVSKTKPKNMNKETTTQRVRGRPRKTQAKDVISANSAETSLQNHSVAAERPGRQPESTNETATMRSSGPSALPDYLSNWVFGWRPVKGDKTIAANYVFKRFDY